MIKVRFILHQQNPRDFAKIPPPVGSTFELNLTCLPQPGEDIYVHKDLLPSFYKGSSELEDIAINTSADAGQYKDTVRITIFKSHREGVIDVVHVVRPDGHVVEMLFTIERHRKLSWREYKKEV
ncbi:hypothetical protein [Herbaspirillum huttiense]|uniref:hypothetical protein n=1 Tax=Herbaspirillum huttiense TaxID=863372 RepID=UPI0031D1F104